MHKIACRNGELKYIYSDELVGLSDIPGSSSTVRASHVDPDPGDPNAWMVDLRPSGGEIHYGFRLRQDALDFEREWLEKNVLGFD